MEKLNDNVSTAITKRLRDYYKVNLFEPYLRSYKNMNENMKSNLIKYDHLVCFNIDLPLSYLFLTTNNNKNQCVLLTQNGMYECYHRFKDHVYTDNTLFIGFVLDNLFIISDLVIYKNKTLNTPLYDRISHCNDMIDNDYIHDPIMCQKEIKVMDYIDYDYIDSMWSIHRLGLSYCKKITGLIFIPTNNNINCVIQKIHACNYTQSKELNTSILSPIIPIKCPKIKMICFFVKATDITDVYELHIMDCNNNLVKYDIAGVPNKEISNKLRSLLSSSKGEYMLCEYDDKFMRWIPLRKSHQTKPDCISLL
uniref:mRNA capping enzyme adenylation domain-containing protein n=1 Tax=viral metagenome TaxID=1070528 RepID=A0A6C0J7U2_9ZZZZ